MDIDGAYIAVGASGDQETAEFSGAVYIFKGSGANWTEQIKLKAEIPRDNGEFGEAVDLDGDHAVAIELFDDAHVFALPPNIPAISVWSGLVLALLVLTIGTVAIRLRRIAAALMLLFLVVPTASAFEPNLSAAHDPEHLLVRFAAGTSSQAMQEGHGVAGAQPGVERFMVTGQPSAMQEWTTQR